MCLSNIVDGRSSFGTNTNDLAANCPAHQKRASMRNGDLRFAPVRWPGLDKRDPARNDLTVGPSELEPRGQLHVALAEFGREWYRLVLSRSHESARSGAGLRVSWKCQRMEVEF